MTKQVRTLFLRNFVTFYNVFVKFCRIFQEYFFARFIKSFYFLEEREKGGVGGGIVLVLSLDHKMQSAILNMQ